jgi:hypothetical protein
MEQAKHSKAASVFVSYAHQDEEQRKKLSDHLGGLRHGGYVREWNDGQKNAEPVSSWPDADLAYVNIAQGLRNTIEAWRTTGTH